MLKGFIPNFARVVLVPIANPQTANDLLKLATSLEHPEHGRVIALNVSLGGGETEAKALRKLEPLVEAFKEKGENIELVSVVSTSIARGILDAVRENGADLLILGVKQPQQGGVILGTIAESVLTTAPCDVIIYRTPPDPQIERVITWANGSMAARVACHIGLILGQAYQKPIEAVFVQNGTQNYWQGLARIEQSLEDLPGSENIKRTVLNDRALLGGLLNYLRPHDLTVVGFAKNTELERWLFGDFSQRLLNYAPGPVILTSRSLEAENPIKSRGRQFYNWIRPTLTRVEQDEILRQGREMAAPSLDFVSMILLATLIASLGLLQNSAAVIIGAMLVAPLMQPIIAYAIGMVTGRIELLRRSLFTATVGIGLALLVSITLGLLLPNETPTTEMLARGNPSLLDAGVALFSGLAGAYATARRGIPAALAGVAIAAALVPPLGTIGMAIAFGETNLAIGASLLFVTNIAYISLAAAGVFFWLGMRPQREENSKNEFRRYIYATITLLAFIPLLLVFVNVSSRASNERLIQRELQAAFAPGQIMEVYLNPDEGLTPTTTDDERLSSDTLRVVAVLRATQNPSRQDVQQAQALLSEQLGRPVALQIIVERVIRP